MYVPTKRDIRATIQQLPGEAGHGTRGAGLVSRRWPWPWCSRSWMGSHQTRQVSVLAGLGSETSKSRRHTRV
jgi:hypothetical protein